VTTYTPRERFWLCALAAVGVVAVNGAFVYGVVTRPGALADALTNPVSLAFLAEALLMLAALAYLLGRWGVARLSWRWFLFLSLVGSMAFALPAVLLWRRGRATTDQSA
jgi:uncharacterized membrane protein YhaH (DUF805 family)